MGGIVRRSPPRHSPPRHSPPQTFTTSDVHHPLRKIRRSPPRTFTTSNVHHLRRSPPQTFTTPDVHHLRHSPPQTFIIPFVKSFSLLSMFDCLLGLPSTALVQGCLDCRNILNAWTVGEFSFGGDDCKAWGMLVGGECRILE